MTGDVREVLKYVPLFAGRTFVIVFDEGLLPEPAVAETLLDLISLQRIGVKLVIVVVGGDVGELADWAVEVEFKAQLSESSIGDDGCLAECEELLKRGQAALVNGRGARLLGPEVGALAVGLGAAKLMVLFNDLPQALPGHSVPAVALKEADSDASLKDAARICGEGVPRVHLLDGHMQGALTAEIFSNEGVGTMVHADSYQETRQLKEEDISELLAMMGRSVRASHLVPRSYEEVDAKRDDFLLMTLDENVVGSVALHRYADFSMGEVACLYVKLSHEDRGYGRDLLVAAEEKAKREGLAGVFALTNRASGFFSKNGYHEGSIEDLPEVRAKILQESGRNSAVWVKRF